MFESFLEWADEQGLPFRSWGLLRRRMRSLDVHVGFDPGKDSVGLLACASGRVFSRFIRVVFDQVLQAHHVQKLLDFLVGTRDFGLADQLDDVFMPLSCGTVSQVVDGQGVERGYRAVDRAQRGAGEFFFFQRAVHDGMEFFRFGEIASEFVLAYGADGFNHVPSLCRKESDLVF